jgi:7,8-dihydroneopterin aldolase/epimerase/oxygenase
MMDRLTIHGLQYHGRHGWYDQEKVDGNHFEVDIDVHGRFRGVTQLDQVADYEAMDKEIRAIMEGRSIDLIETLCENIGETLRTKLPEGSKTLTVRVRKVPPPIETPSAYAEIQMSWEIHGG